MLGFIGFCLSLDTEWSIPSRQEVLRKPCISRFFEHNNPAISEFPNPLNMAFPIMLGFRALIAVYKFRMVSVHFLNLNLRLKSYDGDVPSASSPSASVLCLGETDADGDEATGA